MKTFGRKRNQPVELPASGLTGRQLTAIAVAFALAIVLIPVGARAAQLVNAVITDPGGVNKATVDAGGNLHVAGAVTVNSSTPVAVTSADDPGRMAFQAIRNISMAGALGVAFVDVPTGKRLVITYVSGELILLAGQTARVELQVEGPGAGDHFFVPTLTGTTTFSYFAFLARRGDLRRLPGRVPHPSQRHRWQRVGHRFGVRLPHRLLSGPLQLKGRRRRPN
jgi:hypothetical protein